ncbi:MAG: IPT/TIG domain-containing protein [Myxococcota bacterium]|nr:IPT/TIG domain-containing protein [Myxococcota bacterium]
MAYASPAMQRRLGWLGMSVLATTLAAACLPGSGPPLLDSPSDAGPPPAIGFGTTDASMRSDVDLGDPFAVAALQPSHGPWTGGTRTTVSGRGFSSKIEVRIGGVTLDSSAVFASTPTRASLVTPPGTPGPADVTMRNVSTGQERTLAAGFSYDALVVSPATGATTGGTRVLLHGSGTHWTGASNPTVGGKPCVAVAFTDASHLVCTTPPGAMGSRDVTVTNLDGTLDQARDAFTYSDSPDGYRGGLFGGALSGQLTVLAFDAAVGTPLTGGQVIAGTNLATALTGTFDSAGAARLAAPSLAGKVTVTVAAKCHQPMTFVDVPVDTVTVYLEPTRDPSCAGDPPSNGNWYGVQQGAIAGELVWTGGIEFQRAPWNNVPLAAGQERRTAYVWTTAAHPLDAFQLPPAANATTPDSGGQFGYSYSLSASPGNQTIYALAGIENRSLNPPTFVPYAMGIARGVFVQPGARSAGVDIPMTTILDHSVTTLPRPPSSGVRGPDRLVSTLAVNVGINSFAILPQGTTTTLLPIAATATVGFYGVPSLNYTLAGATYDLTAAAVSGASGGLPQSVLTRVETTDANNAITLSGFLPIPVLLQPAVGSAWSGTHVVLDATANAGAPMDLIVLHISSGSGLVTWRIVAPGAVRSFELPDLAMLAGVGRLVRGPLTTTLSVAHIESFDYAALRWGQLANSAWSAYAEDMSPGLY